MSHDGEGMKAGKRDRRLYLSGPNRGEVRPSRQARTRRRLRREEWQRAAEVTSGDNTAEGEQGMEAGVEERWFRLGRGFRDTRDGVTCYGMESSDSEDSACGRWIVVEAEDVRSGRRWFREEYPDTWTEKWTGKEREEKASRGLETYGKEYVEYKGQWREVEERC